MTIDFAGVVSMADAIGGVEVCVNQNVWDRPLPGVPGGSGLKMRAGSEKVEGERALQWLRTRHAWGSDLLRARAQHMYMNSMIRTLRDQNVFTDTGRLTGPGGGGDDVADGLGGDRLGEEAVRPGMQLKTVPPDRITMTTLPTVEDPQNRNHLLPAGAGAEQVWAMLRDDVAFDAKGGASGKSGKDGSKRGPPRPPATRPHPTGDRRPGAERHRSATLGPVGGRAAAVAGTLVSKGFTRAAPDTSAALAEERTRSALSGRRVARGRPAGRRVARDPGEFGQAVHRCLTVSRWWSARTGARARPIRSSRRPRRGPAGDADALNGSETGTCMDVYEPYRW
ncbi:hypothetical protein GCM10023238_16710 [Streptomyces heliomycini]